MRYRGARQQVPTVLCNVGRYRNYLRLQPGDLVCAFCSDPHGNLQDRGRPGPPQPSNLGEQMHKGPLIGHPLPLQRKRMCQRHPLAAWPPGRGGIRRPKRPSSHGGAGPGCTTVEREPKTPLASLGGPCETSTLATLVRRPQIHTFPLGPAHHHFSHQHPHQPPSASGPVEDMHMLTHATQSIHPQPGREHRRTAVA